MKTAGRASPVLILGIVALLVLVGIFFFAGATPTSTASKFMTALGQRDVDTLAKLSHMPGKTPDQIRKEWEYTTGTAGPHYKFAFRVIAAKESTDDTASVSMHVFRDADLTSTYAEKYELPLVRVDDQWLVEVNAINRQMYPGLPR